MGDTIAEISSIEQTVVVIVEEILKVAPLIQAGVATAEPYVQALIGLIRGTNVSQDDLDSLIATVKAQSDEFQKPLPDAPTG